VVPDTYEDGTDKPKEDSRSEAFYDESFFRQPSFNRQGQTTEREFRFIRYSTRVWLLQERAGLSFADARIYTHREKPESFADIDEKFSFEPGESERRYPQVCAEVEEKLKTVDVFCGFDPVYPEDVLQCIKIKNR
jgi:hypothetical protein